MEDEEGGLTAEAQRAQRPEGVSRKPVRRWRYEDSERPWEPDGVLRQFVIISSRGESTKPKRRAARKSNPEGSGENRKSGGVQRPAYAPEGFGATAGRSRAKALDLGMGYGRNAVWLAERGFEVEGWELDGKYVREARREWRRRRDDSSRAGAGLGRLRVQQGDFSRREWRGPYDVIVISQALHQLKRSQALRVLRRAKRALKSGGRLFLLAKLTRDKHVRRVAQSAEWERVGGEKNTWRRSAGKLKIENRKSGEGKPEFHVGRPRRRWTLLSALTGSEIRGALRGLRLVHYREVVLQSDWCAQGASASGGEENAVVTHTVAEVVGEKA